MVNIYPKYYDDTELISEDHHATGTIGARLHIPFPVLNRSSFGFWFSYFSVISRVVLSMFWFGIQVRIGPKNTPDNRTQLSPSRPLQDPNAYTKYVISSGHSKYVHDYNIPQMLKAIWPSLAHLPNHLSPDANITTSGIMCYFLYWLIQFPFMLISPQKIRWLFVVKVRVSS